jgi:ADP-heptose:LPS heptosyltransferase
VNTQVRSNIMIVQVTRLGDLIQTYQAARTLKKYYPNVELSLVARRKFAEPLRFLLGRVFSRIYTFETKDFFSYEGKKTIAQSTEALDHFIKK